MELFLGPEVVNEEPNIDEDEVRCRVRTVENPLESSHIRPIYPMVDGRSSAETPVREIRGETEIEQDGLMENETHEKSGKKSETCRDKEDSQVLGNRSRKEYTPLLCDQECDQKLKIIPSAVDERRESEAIYQRDDDEISYIRSDQIVENIEFWECLLLPEIQYKETSKENQKNFFKEIHSRDPKLAPEKYGSENAPRKDGEKDAKNTVEHGRKL